MCSFHDIFTIFSQYFYDISKSQKFEKLTSQQVKRVKIIKIIKLIKIRQKREDKEWAKGRQGGQRNCGTGEENVGEEDGCREGGGSQERRPNRA